MRILITGGLGFIGSFAAEHLIVGGHQVDLIDDMRGNVVESIEGATLVSTATVGDRYVLPTNADLIVHCAAPVGSVGVLSYAGELAHEITASTKAVIDAAVTANCPLVNISTSEVYGFSGEYRESDACQLQPGYGARREYAAGKIAAEHMVANTCRTGHLRAINVRPFNVAGPRQSRAKGFVLPTFVEQALAGAPLTVFGTGDQERSFTAVTDVVEFIVRAIEHPEVWDGRAFNVGSAGNRTSINALARAVLERTGSDSEIVHVDPTTIHGPDYCEADGYVKVPMTGRAAAIGWRPQTDLGKLIDLTVRDYRRVAA